MRESEKQRRCAPGQRQIVRHQKKKKKPEVSRKAGVYWHFRLTKSVRKDQGQQIFAQSLLLCQ